MKKETQYDQIVRAALYWVAEASSAVADIAFIRAFNEVRQGYVDRKGQEEISNPIYSPVGRVAVQRLHATSDSLVLFCSRAFDSTGRAFNLNQFKNLIVSYPANAFDRERGKELSLENIAKGEDWDSVSFLRNKFVAHIEKNSF